jgi:3-dehydroquinate synthetase
MFSQSLATSLIINLGGGVVTDLWVVFLSTAVDLMFLPTTMVDASGGTGLI